MNVLDVLVDYYARSGQGSFFGEWKESDHPRDDEGKFTGGGATIADEPFELTRQKVREGGPDKKKDSKERQGKLLEGLDDKPGQTTMEKMWDRIKAEREESKHYSMRSDVEQAAEATQAPSEAQAEAGNYKKGKVRLHGLEISIENAKGSKRRPEWPPLSAHYGYINRTEGRDGDHVDCYIGPRPESEIVFVIDQLTEGGRFDEHKCVLGVDTEDQAKRLYLANYPDDWKCGPITALTVSQFKDWLESGDTKKPIEPQA